MILPVVAFGLLMALAGIPSVSISQDSANDNGYIIINDARLTPVSEGWQLDARAEIRLSPVMRAGLDSGVPLEFVAEVRLQRRRDWWFDHTVFVYEQRYTLNYYELTRHYRLQVRPAELLQGERGDDRDARNEAAEAGSSYNFRSLHAALDQMGIVRGIALPVDHPAGDALLPTVAPDAGTPGASGALTGRLTIRLDDRALPLPLQPVFSSTWRLSSKEYVWPLN